MSAVLTDAEAAARIASLRVHHREALAAPLMSEGSISSSQVRLMGKAPRARWERLTRERMEVESEIRALSRPYAARAAEERALELEGARHVAQRALELLWHWERTPPGKRGVRPTVKRQIEIQRANIRAAIDGYPELEAEFGEPAGRAALRSPQSGSRERV